MQYTHTQFIALLLQYNYNHCRFYIYVYIIHPRRITYATADSCLIQSHLSWLGTTHTPYTHTHSSHTFCLTNIMWFLCFRITYKNIAITSWHFFFFMDNSGKVWLIRTSIQFLHYYTHTQPHPHTTQHSMVNFDIFAFVHFYQFQSLIATWETLSTHCILITSVIQFAITLSRLCEVHFAKHVIQASTASSHRVGKCIFEPSKQSRIRKSSFWSHRRSTVHWETALSSKERSRRVNCPMLVPYNTALTVY